MKRGKDDLHEADEGTLCINDLFGKPFLLAPSEESLDCGPRAAVAGFPGIVPVPDGIGETDEGIDEFETSDEAAVLVVHGGCRGRICKGLVLLFADCKGGPEAGVARILEQTALVVVLVMEGVKVLCVEPAAPWTPDWDGVGDVDAWGYGDAG